MTDEDVARGRRPQSCSTAGLRTGRIAEGGEACRLRRSHTRPSGWRPTTTWWSSMRSHAERPASVRGYDGAGCQRRAHTTWGGGRFIYTHERPTRRGPDFLGLKVRGREWVGCGWREIAIDAPRSMVCVAPTVGCRYLANTRLLIEPEGGGAEEGGAGGRRGGGGFGKGRGGVWRERCACVDCQASSSLGGKVRSNVCLAQIQRHMWETTLDASLFSHCLRGKQHTRWTRTWRTSCCATPRRG